MVALTTFVVNDKSRFFCRIRKVDGVPQKCEVAAKLALQFA
jgi:hypothetical protein